MVFLPEKLELFVTRNGGQHPVRRTENMVRFVLILSQRSMAISIQSGTELLNKHVGCILAPNSYQAYVSRQFASCGKPYE